MRSRWFVALIVFLILGFVDSVYMIYHFYQVNIAQQAAQSFCVINSVIDCDRVARGFGSTLLGIPVATLGMFAHLYLLIAFICERLMRPKLYPHLYCIIYLIVVMMVVFAAYEAFVSFVIIKAVCIMCVGLYLLTTLMMISCRRALTTLRGKIWESLYKLFYPHIAWPYVKRLGVVLGASALLTSLIAYGTDRYLVHHFMALQPKSIFMFQ